MLMQNDMQQILVYTLRNVHLILCFCFLPFPLWWYHQLAHGFFLVHPLCLCSCSLKVTTTVSRIRWVFCLVGFLHINILLKELEWEQGYFAEHFLGFYIIFFQA